MGSNGAYIDREIPHLERLMVVSPKPAPAGTKIAVIGHLAPEHRPALLAALAGHTIIGLAGTEELCELAGYEGLCW
jgi:hypothetical protein